MPRGQVKASADVFVGCSSQFLKLQWKPSPREIITKALEGRVLAVVPKNSIRADSR